jgi:hypothetical protein
MGKIVLKCIERFPKGGRFIYFTQVLTLIGLSDSIWGVPFWLIRFSPLGLSQALKKINETSPNLGLYFIYGKNISNSKTFKEVKIYYTRNKSLF